MLSIYETFCKGKDAPARMLTCYIEEAHAKDEWHFPNSAVTLDFNAEIAVHRSIDERIAAAKLFKERTKTHCLEVVCDSMEGHLVQRYDAWPERLYVSSTASSCIEVVWVRSTTASTKSGSGYKSDSILRSNNFFRAARKVLRLRRVWDGAL